MSSVVTVIVQLDILNRPDLGLGILLHVSAGKAAGNISGRGNAGTEGKAKRERRVLALHTQQIITRVAINYCAALV